MPVTATEFKILLMVPCIGMKRFGSHSNTPTTIRANKICMKGILFFLSVLVARHFQQGPHFQRAFRYKLSFDILDACVGRGERPPAARLSSRRETCPLRTTGFRLSRHFFGKLANPTQT